MFSSCFLSGSFFHCVLSLNTTVHRRCYTIATYIVQIAHTGHAWPCSPVFSSRLFPCFIVHCGPLCITVSRRRCCTGCCTARLLALPHDSAQSGQGWPWSSQLWSIIHWTCRSAQLICCSSWRSRSRLSQRCTRKRERKREVLPSKVTS